MTCRTLSLAVALLVPAVLAAPARAETQEDLALTLVAAQPTVTLGDDVALTVRLTNRAQGRTHTVRAPVMDYQSVYFRAWFTDEQGEHVFVLTRFHMTPNPRTQRVDHEPIPEQPLAPGAALELAWRFPAVQVGVIRYRAHYKVPAADGLFPEVLTSSAVAITVTPRAGKTQLRVRLETNYGAVTLGLLPQAALGHVDNFVRLVKAGAYDGLTFHRLRPGSFIQGGCPQGDGSGGPGYSIPLETAAGLKHTAGTLSAARAGWSAHTAGQQFFIMAGAEPGFDPVPGAPGREGYSVFGEVTAGRDVVEKISRLPTLPAPGSGEQSRPQTQVRLEQATLVYED